MTEEQALKHIVAGGFAKDEFKRAIKVYACSPKADDNEKKTKATTLDELLSVFDRCHALGLNSVFCEDGTPAVAISGFWNKKQGKLDKVIYPTVPALLQRAHAKGLACYSYVYPPAGVGEYTTITRKKYSGEESRITSFSWIAIEFYRVVQGKQVGPSTSERVLLQDAVPAHASQVWEQHASKMHANAALRRAVIRMFHLNAEELDGAESIGSGSGASVAQSLAEDIDYDDEVEAEPEAKPAPKRRAAPKAKAKPKAKPAPTPKSAASVLDDDDDDDEEEPDAADEGGGEGNDEGDGEGMFESPFVNNETDAPGDE